TAHQHKGRRHPDIDDASEGEDREGCRIDQRPELGEAKEPELVDAVNDGAGEHADDDARPGFANRVDAQPCRGMGELPGEPAHGDALGPHAEIGGDVAEDIEPVIAERQRLPQNLEADGNPHRPPGSFISDTSCARYSRARTSLAQRRSASRYCHSRASGREKDTNETNSRSGETNSRGGAVYRRSRAHCWSPSPRIALRHRSRMPPIRSPDRFRHQ